MTILNAKQETALDVARLKKRVPIASYLQKRGALQSLTDEKTIDNVTVEEEPQPGAFKVIFTLA